MTASRIAPAALALMLLAPAANAQSANDRALAETLFRDAKQLMKQGKFAEACPKLAESQKLDPGGGTLINLAKCHESQGKTATAWTEYQDALAMAKRDGNRDRVKVAEAAIGALEPKLAKMTVTVDAANAADVSLDGAPLPRVAFGVTTPIDPGSHVVSASAAGKKAWQSEIVVAAAESKVVAVPTLEDEAKSVVAPTPVASQVAPVATITPSATDASLAPEKSSRGWMTGKRAVGLAAGGVGIAGVGVGVYLALNAISLRSQSDDGCVHGCTPSAVDLNNQAIDSANLANVGFAVGVVGLAVGTVLLIVGSPSKSVAFDHARVGVTF